MTLKVYTGSAFEDKTLKVNALANIIDNPDFAGSGTVAGWWSAYTSGTSVAGTRSVSSNLQTLTATSLVTTSGNRRFGIINYASKRVRIETNSIVYYSVLVDTSGMAAGTTATFYFEEKNDSTTLHFRSHDVTPGATIISGSITSHTAGVTQIGTIGCFISATSDWTGTSTVVFSKAILCILNPGETPPAWFSGSSSGCAWVGAANNSISLAPGFRTARVKRYNGSAWVSV